MSMMQEQRHLVAVLPPGRVRRSFPKQFKADAVAQPHQSIGPRDMKTHNPVPARACATSRSSMAARPPRPFMRR